MDGKVVQEHLVRACAAACAELSMACSHRAGFGWFAPDPQKEANINIKTTRILTKIKLCHEKPSFFLMHAAFCSFLFIVEF